MASQFERLVLTASPYPDESFAGYLTRLTELNHYDTPAWILQMAQLRNYPNKEVLAFGDGRNFRLLSQLTGIEMSRLNALTYRLPQHRHKRQNRFGDCLIFGLAVPRTALRLNPAKICTECLREHGYVRRIWGLTVVTVCPLHTCLLIDECPNCHRSVRFIGNRLSICKCQYDWRNATPKSVEETETELTRRIHSLCSLPGRLNFPEYHESLGALRLKELLSILSLIASQYYRALHRHRHKEVDTLGGCLKDRINSAELHGVLCKAMHVFRDWPKNFFSFLGWRSQELASNKASTGLTKDFGQFQEALYTGLKSVAFDFIRDAFEDYLATIWEGGHKSRRLRKKGRPDAKFVSKPEAVKLLRVSQHTVDDLLSNGKLRAVIRPAGGRRIILIERRTVDELIAERSEFVDQKQTAKLLGISDYQTKALISAKLLTGHTSHDQRSTTFYSVKEINDLLGRVTHFGIANQHARNDELGFAQSLRLLSSYPGIGVSEFIHAILEGKIRPCRLTDQQGFRTLQFLRAELIAWREIIFRRQQPDALNTVQAAKALNVHPKVIQFLIKKKLLDAKRFHWHLAISPNAIAEFRSRYVLAHALTKTLKTNTQCLAKILETQDIRPIPDSIVHKKPGYYVFNRSDVERIKVDQLIKSNRASFISPTQLLDITAAAQFVHTRPEVLADLAANGVLTTKSSQTRTGLDKKCFGKTQLRRLIGKVKTYLGLVTANVAAQMCGRSISYFHARLLKAYALKVVHIDGDHRRFFQKTDVEEVAARMKELVGAADVRVTLKLGESQLIRLIESGELRPVSGPKIDGFGHNLFSKHDVEIIRKQRECFKRKRMREGGSQRFGKSAGPKRSPVMEAIRPRIKQLLANAAREGHRISGIAIHSRLVSEGYEVGINSVYVCLRKAPLLR